MRYEKGFIQKLKVEWEKLGRESGYKQLPPIDATSDENEREVVRRASEKLSEIEEAHGKYIKKFSDDLNRNINNCSLINDGSINDNSVEQQLGSLRMQFDEAFSNHREGIKEAKSKYFKYVGLMKKFRDENKLEREGKYPESHWYYFAIIALIIVVEAIFNAYAHQGDGGLLEGAFIAFSISTFNVIFALALGRGFTYKNLISEPKKVFWGWIALFAFIIESVYCNSLYATFRSEYHEILIDNPVDTMVAMKTSFGIALNKAHHIFFAKMPFTDLMSYLTFAMTMVFACVAFFEGYFWDDPCPVYGEKDRDLKAMKAEVNAREKALDEEMDKICKNSLKPFQEKINEVSPLTPANLLNSATTLQNEYDSLMMDVDMVNLEVGSVVNCYREVNKTCRGDKLEPEIFKKAPLTLRLQYIDGKYRTLITGYKDHALHIKVEFSDLMKGLSFFCEDFRNKSNAERIKMREQYRLELDSRAAIISSQIALKESA